MMLDFVDISWNVEYNKSMRKETQKHMLLLKKEKTYQNPIEGFPKMRDCDTVYKKKYIITIKTT